MAKVCLCNHFIFHSDFACRFIMHKIEKVQLMAKKEKQSRIHHKMHLRLKIKSKTCFNESLLKMSWN